MTTPTDPTTPGWASPHPSGGTGSTPSGGGGPAQPGPAPGASPVQGAGPTPPTAPAGGWGPGYTSPASGHPVHPPAPPHGSAPPVGRPWPSSDPRAGAPRSGPGYGWAPAPRPGIIPLRPLGLGEILDGAFRAIRANPRVMFGLSAVVVSITVAIQAVLQWYVGGLVSRELGGVVAELDPTGDLGFTETLGPTVAAVLTAPIVSLAVTVLTGLLIVSVSRSVIGQKVTAGEVWSQAWRRVLLLVLFSFVTSVVVLLAWGGWVALLVLLGTGEQWPLVAAVGLVGGLGLLVVTVWFLVRLMLIPATLVLEGTDVGTALRRGWRLTRGSFWRLLGIYLLTSVMVAVVAQLIVMPAAFVAAFALRDPLLTSFGALAVTSVASAVAYTLTTSFMAAVVALLYIDVRMRREGLDVELTRAASEPPA